MFKTLISCHETEKYIPVNVQTVYRNQRFHSRRGTRLSLGNCPHELHYLSFYIKFNLIIRTIIFYIYQMICY